MADLIDRLLAFASTLANEEEDLVNEAAKQIAALTQANQGLQEQLNKASSEYYPPRVEREVQIERISMQIALAELRAEKAESQLQEAVEMVRLLMVFVDDSEWREANAFLAKIQGETSK